jgi:hypothetical protein
MKMNHATNGKSIQWQPFIEERRRSMLERQQPRPLCSCIECQLPLSPHTPPTYYEENSPYSSQDDSIPSSPTIISNSNSSWSSSSSSLSSSIYWSSAPLYSPTLGYSIASPVQKSNSILLSFPQQSKKQYEFDPRYS